MEICLIQTRPGIIPGAGASPRLTPFIEIPIAKNLIFTALELIVTQGVIDLVSEEGKTGFDCALGLAGEISINNPLAVRAAKREQWSSQSKQGSISSLPRTSPCYIAKTGSGLWKPQSQLSTCMVQLRGCYLIMYTKRTPIPAWTNEARNLRHSSIL